MRPPQKFERENRTPKKSPVQKSNAANHEAGFNLKDILEGLHVGASVVAIEDRRRLYANSVFLKFFRGTSLKTLEDIKGLRTEDYHAYNPFQLEIVDRRMAGLEKVLIERGGTGYNFYDQSVVLPEDKGFIFYDAFLRPIGEEGQPIALVWYFQETTWLQSADKVFEAYLASYRNCGLEREGVYAFLHFFGLKNLLQKKRQKKQFVRVLLSKTCKDEENYIKKNMYRAVYTISSYATHINRDLEAAGVTVRDVRQRVESKLRATRERENIPEEEDFWNLKN